MHNNTTHWIIQKNIAEKDLNDLIEAIEQNGMTYETFFHVPFSNEYPVLPNHNNVFVYAASAVTDKIKNDHAIFKGVFALSEEINIEKFHSKSPELMWNNPFFIDFMNKVLVLPIENDHKKYFIRPIIDDKVFAGQIMTQSDIKKWINDLSENDTELNILTTKVLISEIKYPQKEYRLFLNQNGVFAFSLYRENMELNAKDYCPDEVKLFAENFYKNNEVPLACVIDVATNLDQIGIIEVNSINNSGFYAANKFQWVKGVNATIKTLINTVALKSKL